MGRQPSPVIAVALLGLLTACASLPTDYPPPPHSATMEPDPGTSLGQLAARFAEPHGPDVSGYAAIDAAEVCWEDGYHRDMHSQALLRRIALAV